MYQRSNRRSTVAGCFFALTVGLAPASLLGNSIPETPLQRHSIATGLHSPSVEHAIDRWFHEAMQYIYMGRPTAARRLADSMIAVAPDDPRPYLLIARILRLDIPDQNFARSPEDLQWAPIDSVLEIGIAHSKRMLEADENSLPGLLYTGWGLMFQSQLRALAEQYWGAGRKAKAGKKYLDRVLEIDPSNADARLILGAFLYFADNMPGVAKVASFLVRIPGGDLERGMQLLDSACDLWGYGHYDALSLMGVVQFGFEGNFESARGYFGRVESEFHRNVRMLEPMTIIDLFLPENLHENLPRITEAVLIHEQSPEPWVRSATARLRLYEAMTELLSGRIELAQSSLEHMLKNLPDTPDWLERSVRLDLADIYLMRGQHDKAIAVQRGSNDAQIRKRLEYVLQEDSAALKAQANSVMQLQPWIRALYEGRFDEVAQGLARWGNQEPLVQFYSGELELLRGQPGAAIDPLKAFLARDTAPRLRMFRFLARTRLAEAYDRTGQRNKAADTLDKAIDLHEDRDLIRHITKARKRWFENDKRPG